jgi:hypothetical protein
VVPGSKPEIAVGIEAEARFTEIVLDLLLDGISAGASVLDLHGAVVGVKDSLQGVEGGSAILVGHIETAGKRSI